MEETLGGWEMWYEEMCAHFNSVFNELQKNNSSSVVDQVMLYRNARNKYLELEKNPLMKKVVKHLDILVGEAVQLAKQKSLLKRSK